MDTPNQVQQRATMMVESWSSCPVRRDCRSWDCSAWSTVGLRGAEQTALQHQKMQPDSTAMHGCRVEINTQKLKRKVQIDIRRNILTVRTGRQHNRLPESLSPSLGIFKTQLDKDLCSRPDLTADLLFSRWLVHPTLQVTGLSSELSCPLFSVVPEERQDLPLGNSHLNELINLYWKPVCLQWLQIELKVTASIIFRYFPVYPKNARNICLNSCLNL